jgi:SAM-dependent methyltransferase
LEPKHIQVVKQTVLHTGTFVRAVLSGRRRGQALQWVKATLRPIMINNQPHVQFSYFDEARDISKNYAGRDIETHLDELLALPFKNVHLQTRERDIHIRISNKGQSSLSSTAHEPVEPSLEHNRQKKRILTPENSPEFLRITGLMTQDGVIKSDKQRKYLQINEFLKLIQETAFLERLGPQGPIVIVDLGCGNAYLTFATYHYINNLLEHPTRLIGVDRQPDIIARNQAKALELGWGHIQFEAASIADFQAEETPNLVIALHACDTATDDALARGITWQSQLIVSAPCCHHHLQAQLDSQPAPRPFPPLFRHAILKERLGDILTDTFRALTLRIMGYSTDVIEFIATEHTPRNLMIRSVRSSTPGDPRLIQEYQELKAFWGVTPYLETLLGEPFAKLLVASS